MQNSKYIVLQIRYMKDARQAAGTKGGVDGHEDHITYTSTVDNSFIGNTDRDNVGAVGDEPQLVQHHTRPGPCIHNPVSICAQRGRGGKAHLSMLSLLDNPLLLSLGAVCLALALVVSATHIGLALVDKLDSLVACALVLVAVLLCVAFDGAEGALVGVAAWGGGLAKCAQSGAANEGAILCVVLDLLDLKGGLKVCMRERLMAHE
jgi:hypothetical protein